MFGVSALDLARIQFAFTMSFHILFPAVTIGLASYLAVLELSWLRTRRAERSWAGSPCSSRLRVA